MLHALVPLLTIIKLADLVQASSEKLQFSVLQVLAKSSQVCWAHVWSVIVSTGLAAWSRQKARWIPGGSLNIFLSLQMCLVIDEADLAHV